MYSLSALFARLIQAFPTPAPVHTEGHTHHWRPGDDSTVVQLEFAVAESRRIALPLHTASYQRQIYVQANRKVCLRFGDANVEATTADQMHHDCEIHNVPPGATHIAAIAYDGFVGSIIVRPMLRTS
jgi:hypothetical protein